MPITFYLFFIIGMVFFVTLTDLIELFTPLTIYCAIFFQAQ